jgi:DNA-binding IscR family transcriptional regulator
VTRFVDPTPGVRCLVQLSEAGALRSLSAAEIARCEGMDLCAVREILDKLWRAGLVEQDGGTGGGFRLARAESSIRLGDVQGALADGGEIAASRSSAVTLADVLAWEAIPFEDAGAALAAC